MQILLSTTNECPDDTTIWDLRARRLYPLPVNNMDLLSSFELVQIQQSESLQELLDEGRIILVTDLGQVIKNLEKDLSASNMGGGGGTTNIQICFTGNSGEPLFGNTRSWSLAAQFIFGGTHKMGQPSKICTISWSKNASKVYGIRVVRAKDGAVLAEKIGLSNTSPEIITLPNPASFPAAPEILEIHMKTEAGGQYKLGSMEIAF